jgi:hypothetical protein
VGPAFMDAVEVSDGGRFGKRKAHMASNGGGCRANWLVILFVAGRVLGRACRSVDINWPLASPYVGGRAEDLDREGRAGGVSVHLAAQPDKQLASTVVKKSSRASATLSAASKAA